MTKTTTANATGSQRKRNTNQTKSNVASQNNPQPQQNSKKGNKQPNQHQTQNQPGAKSATSTTTSTPASPTPPVQAEEPHTPLIGFNGDEIDTLLKSGYDEKALIYKSEQSIPQQKAGPWGQKRMFLAYKDNMIIHTDLQ